MWRERATPTSSPLLTDFYQISMGYSYFLQGRHQEHASFDVFYRKNPFDGFYTQYFGAEDVKEYVTGIAFNRAEIAYIIKMLNIPDDTAFKSYLAKGFKADREKIKFINLPEGTLASPKVPLMRIEGPLFVCQLVETAVLALTGFATLVATNASRISAAARGRPVLEFGLRRAQGPNGGMTASKYAVLGGCLGTSNVLSGFLNGFDVKGTMAHSYICSFQRYDTVPTWFESNDLANLVFKIRDQCREVGVKGWNQLVEASGRMDLPFPAKRFISLRDNELIAFIAYASNYPSNFLALVDTYESRLSGTVNYLYVSLALLILGNKPIGIRLDSGDLGSLARSCREIARTFFTYVAPKVCEEFGESPNFNDENGPLHFAQKGVLSVASKLKQGTKFHEEMRIVASNDLHEESIKELFKKDPDLQINMFGVGTHLATCKSQPALGAVYKLTSIEGSSCVKFSNDEIKQTYPGKKTAYRLYRYGKPIADVLGVEHESLESRSISVFSKDDFNSERALDFDEAFDLYQDHIEQLIDKLKPVNMRVSTLLKTLESNLTEEASSMLRRLRATLCTKLRAMVAGQDHRLSKFEWKRVKAATRRAMFADESDFLSATRTESKEKESDFGGSTSKQELAKQNKIVNDFPVYLTEALRNEIKQTRGLS